MVDWSQGGWTGSINRWAKREVQDQLSKNPVARARRYPLSHRILKALFSSGSFVRLVLIYLNVSVLVAIAEVLSSTYLAQYLPPWPQTFDNAAVRILHDVPGYLIGAQVSLVGVISLALALISLIAQRDEASLDVQVYYHESLFFGIVASSLALVLILTFQLFWPIEILLRQLGAGTANPSFRLILLGVHASWFCLNVLAILHFVGVTFRFVQRSARQKLRERYTANILFARDLRSRLRLALYRSASEGIADDIGDSGRKAQLIAFGSKFSEPFEAEVTTRFPAASELYDVRVNLVRWALRRWCQRCSASVPADSEEPSSIFRRTPSLWFTPQLDQPLRNTVVWCCRSGGVPLHWSERFAIRMAFKFARTKDDE